MGSDVDITIYILLDDVAEHLRQWCRNGALIPDPEKGHGPQALLTLSTCARKLTFCHSISAALGAGGSGSIGGDGSSGTMKAASFLKRRVAEPPRLLCAAWQRRWAAWFCATRRSNVVRTVPCAGASKQARVSNDRRTCANAATIGAASKIKPSSAPAPSLLKWNDGLHASTHSLQGPAFSRRTEASRTLPRPADCSACIDSGSTVSTLAQRAIGHGKGTQAVWPAFVKLFAVTYTCMAQYSRLASRGSVVLPSK